MNLFDIATLLNQPRDLMLQSIPYTSVTIDSRQVKPGDVFVAIRGERFDGHDFVHQAVALGASAVLVERELGSVSVPQWVVPNTLNALVMLATHYRRQYPCRVIALTGSNGKTTVKEMIASILPPPSLSTLGNLNNHIGVPLSIMRLQPQHRYAVFELGANHRGEIAHTVSIVQPHVTLINNIAPAHIEGFGSIDGVAQAKGEIYQGLLPGGTAVINADDAYAHFWDDILADKNVVKFSLTLPTEIRASALSFDSRGCAQFQLETPLGDTRIQLRVPGQHNVSNALAAAACTYALGLSLAEIGRGLQQFGGVKGRMTYLHGKQDALIIDDTYNANLRSALSALEVLAKTPGKRIFVFGDMGELGAWSEQHHHDVGARARELGIDMLMTIGQHSEAAARAFGVVRHYHHYDDLVADLLPYLGCDTVVLVKGSRSAAMENVVQHLVAESMTMEH